MDRRAWWATVHGVTKRYDLNMTEWEFLKENTDSRAPSLGTNSKVWSKNILYNKPPWLGLGHHACNPWAKSSHWQNCPMACLCKVCPRVIFHIFRVVERKGKERRESLTNSEIFINRSFPEKVCQSLSLIILVHSFGKYVITTHSMLSMYPNSADGDTGAKRGRNQCLSLT